MWVELPNLWIAIANILGIPAIHFFLSWVFTRMPRSSFDPESFLFRIRGWENEGKWYQTWFRIRQWKHLLPDAAPWLKGFAKGSLSERDPHYMRNFIAETCRGEAAHYAQIPGILLTLIWNPWPVAAVIMIVYAFLSNLPCILLQRFTRARMTKVLNRGPF